MLSRYHYSDTTPLHPGDAVAAIIVLEDGRYLLQLRDDKPGIFFPGHWGLFGGAVEEGEALEPALRRELKEELGLRVADVHLVCQFDFDFKPIGLDFITRVFYEVLLPADTLSRIQLGEGEAVRAFSQTEVLSLSPVAPYDAFALWFHANRYRLS